MYISKAYQYRMYQHLLKTKNIGENVTKPDVVVWDKMQRQRKGEMVKRCESSIKIQEKCFTFPFKFRRRLLCLSSFRFDKINSSGVPGSM